MIQVRRTGILAPANILAGGHILLDKRTTLLVVIDTLLPVALPKLFAEDLRLLDLDKLLANHKLTLLEEGDGIGVGLGGVEIIRGFLVELRVVAVEHHGVEQGRGGRDLGCTSRQGAREEQSRGSGYEANQYRFLQQKDLKT